MYFLISSTKRNLKNKDTANKKCMTYQADLSRSKSNIAACMTQAWIGHILSLKKPCLGLDYRALISKATFFVRAAR